MDATAAVRYNPQVRRFFKRPRAQGEAHRIALVAVMQTVVVLVNVLLHKNYADSADVRKSGLGVASVPRGLGRMDIQRTFDTPHLYRQLAKVALQMVKDLLLSCFNGLDLRRHSPDGLDGLDLRQSPSL